MELNALLAYVIAVMVAISVFALVVGLFANNKKLLHERQMDELINNIVVEEIKNNRKSADLPKAKTWAAYWHNLGQAAGIEQTTPNRMGLIAIAVGGGIWFLGSFAYPRDFLIGTLLAAGAVAVLRMALVKKADKRLQQIDKQLPALLSGMRANLSANMTPQQAILSQVGEIPAPLGNELIALKSDLDLNIGLDTALENMSLRVPSRELSFLVSSMRIAITQGANLDDLLKTLQGILTQRAGIRDKLATAVAQAQPAIYITAAAIPLGLIFSYMSDAANRTFWVSFIGLICLAGIAVCYAAALFVANKQIQKVKDA
jgi:tight adherence protein B